MRLAWHVTLLALVLAAGTWFLVGRRDDPFQLPAEICVEETVADLSASFDHAAVAEEAPGAPVRADGLKPSSHYGDPAAGYRRAIVAPPPSRLHFRVHVPRDAQLRFSAAVQGPEQHDGEAAGLLFGVSVDGRRVFARTINPAGSSRDRRWVEQQVDLAGWAERDVDLELSTEAAAVKARLAGTPGWSHVRIVRVSRRERQRESPVTPSVLVLLVDTLRADRLGCYGASPSPTPTLDRLAAEGLVFDHAVAQSSWTMPSVASLFTGLYPRSHGVTGGAADGVTDPGSLSDALPTLAERAAAAGITTVAVSGNPLVSRATNLARGFETFVEFSWDRGRRDWPSATDIDPSFLRWLDRNPGRRFLAYLHYMEPHDPYTPPRAIRPPTPSGVRPAIAAGQVEDLAREINWHGAPLLPAAEVGHLRQLYDAEIHAWDAELAELLKALSQRGRRESIVIVMMADHGEEFQDHGRLKHRLHLYDELVHVPLVIAGPGVRPGRVTQQARVIDLFPTIAKLLGASTPEGLTGYDLLAPHATSPAISETLFGVTADGTQTPLVSLRTLDWKLIHMPALGRYELFDLVHDPGEHEDRFAVAAEGAAMAKLLGDWEAAAQAPPAAESHDPALQEKLRALGYVD